MGGGVDERASRGKAGLNGSEIRRVESPDKHRYGLHRALVLYANGPIILPATWMAEPEIRERPSEFQHDRRQRDKATNKEAS